MRIVTLSLIVALQASLSSAASFPTSISRHALNVGLPSERLSVGVNYVEIERGVDFDLSGAPDAILEATSGSLYVGYDILPWLTTFGTIGAVELDSEPGIATDAGLKVSVGASAYLWEADILEPIFMAGRFSFKSTFEISQYTSDSTAGDVSWIDATVAFPLGYERFDRFPESAQGIATSLALYVGPALSYVSGTVDTPEGDVDFDGDELLGVIGGVDIYLAPQVSLGVQVAVFDETTIGATLRFHL